MSATILEIPIGIETESEIQTLLRETREAKQDAINYLKHQGIELPLDKWLTIKKYSEMFDVSLQVVNNWITRGIIPPDNIRTIEELNGLRMIKAVKYR
jgi:hypothetical protein